MHVDVHQHIWTQPLLEALEQRDTLPFVRRSGGVTVLHSAGEPAWMIDAEAERPDRRAALLRVDRVDRALVALSSPIGIEALPRGEAQALIDAHLDGVAALPGAFAAWGPVPLDDPDPEDVEAVLARGCLGVSLPAQALATPDYLPAIASLLEAVQDRQVPLFVHPGPAPGRRPPEVSLSEPLWWRALTDYVAQMHAAWLTFTAVARPHFPDLAVVFAMLAGGAPLHVERLLARGGPPIALRDPLVFYDTSSYGPAALEVLARRVGPGQLLYGSDRPVVAPSPTGREAVLQANAGRFLESFSGNRAGARA